MKMPDIRSRRFKLRNAKIIREYSKGEHTLREIGEMFGMSSTNVNQILYDNRHLLTLDREYEKAKRIGHLKLMLNRAGTALSRGRDATDVIVQLRKEIEGDKPQVENHTHLNLSLAELMEKASKQLDSSRLNREASELRTTDQV